ncbi:hypothetical protein AX15_006585 [Amanita polypyramis BW_CC]|nr:hypothetical protein AX15_006585 [Amanita polypyramis BW_CC]
MAGELVGWDWQFLIQPYNQKWRDQRKLFTQYFHPSKTSKSYPVLQQQAHLLLKRVIDAPEDIQHHLQNAVASMAIMLAYGIHVSPHGDPHVHLAERALDGFGRAATPGAFLVDVLPFLKHVPSFFPGAGFQKQAAVWRQWMLEFVNSPFVTAQKEIEEGIARPSLTSHYLDTNDGSKLTPEHIENVKEVAATVFTAAAHTTTSLLCTFVLAMILFPEVQKKIQEELDRTVGQDRLPGFEDLGALPYLVATIKEAARWNPPTPLAIPHSIIEDDEYNGYRIPKGSTVIGNAWSILHNEEHYKDPMIFRPERFLTEDGRLDPTVLNPFDVAFGFGRRTCPGVHIAFAISYICTASLLSVFNITKTVDKNGNTIEVPGKYEQIIVLQPEPFKSILKPRNKDAAKLVMNLS